MAAVMFLWMQFPVAKLMSDQECSFPAGNVVSNEDLPQLSNQERIRASEHSIRWMNIFNREVLSAFRSHGVYEDI